LNGGDLPCEELPGGDEECYDEPPTPPNPGDPAPPSPEDPFNDIDLAVSNEIFLNPYNPSQMVFLVTTHASQPIAQIWAGALAYVDGYQFFGDVNVSQNTDYDGISTLLYLQPSHSLLKLEGLHQWDEYDTAGNPYTVVHYSYSQVGN
jgi:hypothetical protein